MANFTPQQIEEFLQEFFDVVGARQYVGARYVPIFGRAGSDTVEWDDLAPYEPLTVVMHDGVSYVSRRYVPAGIDISDIAYWVETYRFNAQVEQYRQQVLTFQDQIDEITEDYVPFPDPVTYPKYGTEGQVLSTLGDGTVKWDDPVQVTPEVAGPAVADWLDDHPEATTTVLDGSISRAKLTEALKGSIATYEGIVNTTNYPTILPTLGDAKYNSYYTLTFNVSMHPTDYPADLGYGTVGMLTIGNANWRYQVVERLNASNSYASRQYYNGAWDVWSYSDGDAFMRYVDVITTANYQTKLPTLGDAKYDSVYTIVFDATTHPADYPTEYGYGTNLLITYGIASYRYQFVINSSATGTYAMRQYYGGSWKPWTMFTPPDITGMSRYMGSVNYNNYLTKLPTLGDADYNSLYVLAFNATTHPADYPVELGYPSLTLQTFGDASWRMQRAETMNATGAFAVRQYYSGSWNPWYYSTPQRKRMVIGTGGDYTNIVEGLSAAYNQGNTDVIVRAGTYDIAADQMALGGPTYFDNETFTSGGPRVGGNNRYYFESGSLVRCVLPSTASSAAQNTYTPFNAGDGDYEIVGLNVYSEFCRYSFHDEMRSAGTYRHTYRDCRMHHNNTGNGYNQCIGGGLGAHGLIDVIGCVFETDTAETEDLNIVSWHNGSGSNIQSFVNIRDCYFKNGHVRFSWYGTSTDVSEMIVCGCSFKTSAVEQRAETGSSTVRNTSVIAWNNEIRGA